MSNNANNLQFNSNFFILYFQLFNALLKVSNGQEKENLQSLNYDVSDKGNGAGVNKGKWVIRRPI